MSELQITSVNRNQLSDSPAHNSEAEDIIHALIQKASATGNWDAVQVDELESLFDENVRNFREGQMEPLHEGLFNLKRSGLVTERVDREKGRIIEVTDKFKEYYKKVSS